MNQGCRQRQVSIFVFFLFLDFVIRIVTASAGVTTDGTLGPALSLAGPEYQISHDLGTLSGNNLFHSFQHFSISKGETATFTGPDAIARVISRVTGGEVSSIDGLLCSQVGKADFFFINPAGVVFGPNARVDVPASFYVAAADEVAFSDGKTFIGSQPNGSSLSSADPVSFGFLSPRPASIVLNGAKLTFSPDSTITMAGGNVEISAMAGLRAQGGDIRVIATGDGGNRVNISNGDTESPPLGRVEMVQSSRIDAGGLSGPESVLIRGKNIRIENSEIGADHRGDEDAQGSLRLYGDEVEIINGDVHAGVYGMGRGTPIMVAAGKLDVHTSLIPGTGKSGISRISTRVKDWAMGGAGDVDINTETLFLTNGGQISSISEAGAQGNGGSVRIRSQGGVTIRGDNGNGIYSGVGTTTLADWGGNGGDIFLDAGDALVSMSGGGSIQAGTSGMMGDSGTIDIKAGELGLAGGAVISAASMGWGSGGDIRIHTSGPIHLAQAGVSTRNYFGPGKPGSIFFSAGHFYLLDNSTISSATQGSAPAGGIQFDIQGDMAVDGASRIQAYTGRSGNAGTIDISARNFRLLGGSRIFAGTAADGMGGKVDIDVEKSLWIDDASFIESGIIFSGGRAGEISIKAGTLDIHNGGLISNCSWGDQPAGSIEVASGTLTIDGQGRDTGIMVDANKGTGRGGDIDINVTGAMTLVNGGKVASTTWDKGRGGNIRAKAGEIFIKGEDAGLFARAESGSTGSAGTLYAEADRVSLSDRGAISIAHLGSLSPGLWAEPGTLDIRAQDLSLNGNAGISALSSGNAPASHIGLTIGGELLVEGGSRITAQADTGDGGDITIDPQLILLGEGLITTSTQGGTGGDISLSSDILVMDSGFIQANTARGARGGDIFINARAIIAEGNRILVGGEKREAFVPGLNIIQAAAPGGEHGNITIWAPDLDITGTLVREEADFSSPVRLVTDPCTAAGGQGESALVRQGRGGAPPLPGDPVDIPWNEGRLKRLVQQAEKKTTGETGNE